MIKLLESIGRYFMLLGKVFSRPEKISIYARRIWFEIDALGFNSISLTAIISAFIGAVVALQMAITLESPFIPQFMIGYATREVMILEFSSTVVALILEGTAHQRSGSKYPSQHRSGGGSGLMNFFCFLYHISRIEDKHLCGSVCRQTSQ